VQRQNRTDVWAVLTYGSDVAVWPLASITAMQRFGSDRSNSGHAGRPLETALLMWWTVPAPGNEVP
jgi:hypothetical protein